MIFIFSPSTKAVSENKTTNKNDIEESVESILSLPPPLRSFL